MRVFRDAPPARNPTRASRASLRVGPSRVGAGDRTGPPEDARWPPRASPHRRRPPGSRLDRAREARRDEMTRSSRRHPPTSRDARSRADPAPRASRPRTVSAKNLDSRFGRFAVDSPRRERNATVRGVRKSRASRDVRFPFSRRTEKSSSDVYRTTDAETLPTDDPPPVPFVTTHAPRISSTASGPLLREVRGWYERQRPVRKGSPKK